MKIDRWFNKVTIIGVSICFISLFLGSSNQKVVLKDNEDLLLGTSNVVDSSIMIQKLLDASSTTNIAVTEESNESTTEQVEEVVTNNGETIEISNEVQTTVETVNVVYDGLTLEELTNKLNNSLNSTLSGYGSLFATYSLQYGMDPYLITAITLLETGCKWNCSQLVTSCNNVGGVKGSPSCGGSSYRAYSTLEEGIKSYIDNLYNNYYSLGLTTAEQMNSKYAESTEWAIKVNAYIESIKAN